MIKNITYTIFLSVLLFACEDKNDYLLEAGETNKIMLTVGMADNPVNYTSATVSGSVNNTANVNVTLYGFLWDTISGNIETSNRIVYNDTSALSGFSYTITGLEINKKYYVQSFVEVEDQMTLASYITEFTTLGCDTPVFEATEVFDTSTTTALARGKIICEGNENILQRGFCWGTNNDPDINDFISINGYGKGEFIGLMNNLTPGTTYYVRAYAKTSTAVFYGDIVSFITTE